VDNQVRLQLFALAYNLGNFLRRLALPKSVKKWSLRTLREKLIRIGAKGVRHSRYIIFQMGEVAVPRALFRKSLTGSGSCIFRQYLRGRDDVANCSKNRGLDGGQRWLYAKNAARSQCLTQKSRFVCVEWRLGRWLFKEFVETTASFWYYRT